jgi:hypothetical protein
MSPRRGALGIAAGLIALLLSAAPAVAQQPQASAAAAVLARLKAATGGVAWDRVAMIGATGEKTSFGLKGPYSSSEDLATGRFARRSDYGLHANAEGLDEAGRWRMDNSGAVHPLDSDEARTVAVTEAWLAARGYLFPERGRADLVLLAPATEGAETFDRILATPSGGRGVTLWIRRSDRRLARATIELDTRVATVRYRDYRSVDGLALPFDIATDNGDQQETGEARISRYSLQGPSTAEPPRRPSDAPRDAAIRGGASVAYAPLRRDPASGFALVEARINGGAPLTFILDTGGHDILTPAAARLLGLPLSGSGFSSGAGAGRTPTQFTRVASLALGDAEMTDQPVVVLQLDLGQAMGANGATTPISGVIGLELFERFTVTLDHAAGRLVLRPPSPQPLAGGAAIRFTGDMPLIEASVDGRSGWFGLDTGNTASVILYKAWVEAKGLPAWFDITVDAAGVGVGGAFTFRRGRAGGLTLAGATLPALPVLLADDHMGALSSRSEAGNIGEGVLSRYTVTFDYAHERVRLDPPSAADGH